MGKIWPELKSSIYIQVLQECIGEERNIYDNICFFLHIVEMVSFFMWVIFLF